MRTHYQRDDAGRLVEKLVVRGGETQWQRMRYRYGSLGRLIAGINHGGRVELEWNAAGQLTLERSLIRGVSHEPHHQYDERGNRTTKLKAQRSAPRMAMMPSADAAGSRTLSA
ncbi:hypothetical protein SMC92_004572 [Cronobacter dublinensis]|nr:hypothetical protein [Cronobacter dublinensis]